MSSAWHKHCTAKAGQGLRPHQAGFTLLEVLIALAILAIVMISLIKISSDNARNLWHLENTTLAAIIAQNHATLLLLSQDKPVTSDGWETLAGRKWYWQATRPGSPTLDSLQYQIKVYLQGDKDPYTELTVLVPKPDEKTDEKTNAEQ